jgi:hypothetical protein
MASVAVQTRGKGINALCKCENAQIYRHPVSTLGFIALTIAVVRIRRIRKPQ